jgi:hypothetical protein
VKRKWREPSATLVKLFRVGFTADALSGKVPNLTLHRWVDGGRVCDGWDEQDGIKRSTQKIVGSLDNIDFCIMCLMKKSPPFYHDDIAMLSDLTTDETLEWITGGKRK